MTHELYEMQKSALKLLVSAIEGAAAMIELFEEKGLGSDRDNWKAVQGLLDQAMHRFPK